METPTIGEIVKKNYKTASVFEKFGLDFCCNGNRSLEDSCRDQNVDPEEVRQALKQVEMEGDDGVNYDSWPMSKLVDHIVKRHHAYVEEKVPQLNAYLDKITRVHGDRHPELAEIRQIFFEVGGELTVHLKKEELMLFPFIKKLEQAKATGTTANSPVFSSVKAPVDMMMDDHAEEGEKLARIAELTGRYQVPADACNTYMVTYSMLDEFERDLHIHIHLENNILFPKAIRVEEELREEC